MKKTHPHARKFALMLGGFFFAVLSIGSQAHAQSRPFITAWHVGAGETITIPTAAGETYSYTVNWGTGEAADSKTYTGDATHTYARAGGKTVTITGTFPRIYFRGNDKGNSRGPTRVPKIMQVKQWGTQAWTSMEGAFYGCSKLQITATDAPSLSEVKSMAYMFAGATALTGHASMNSWNVSNVKDMSGMFYRAAAFNQNIGSWNTAQVKDMSYMFFKAATFNRNIGNWNTAQVENMQYMFYEVKNFNQPIGKWSTAQVTNMKGLFYQASAFNQNLNDWNVSNVTDMSYMFFESLKTFAKDIDFSKWDVSNVVNMKYMFYKTFGIFYSKLDDWNVSKVTDMSYMFAESFFGYRGSIGNWNVSHVANMTNMFDVNSGFTEVNVAKFLKGWAALPSLQKGVTLTLPPTKYCSDAQAAVDKLKKAYGWKIVGSALSAPELTVKNPSPICPGASVDLTTLVTNGTATDVTYWAKSTRDEAKLSEPLTGSARTVSPTQTTTYYIKKAPAKPANAKCPTAVQPVVVTVTTMPEGLSIQAATPSPSPRNGRFGFAIRGGKAQDKVSYTLTGATASGSTSPATLSGGKTPVYITVTPKPNATQVALTLTSAQRGTCSFNKLSSLASKTASITVASSSSSLGLEAVEQALTLYPVPVKESLNIRIAQAPNGHIQLTLSNTFGQTVAHWTATRQHKTWEDLLDMSHIPPGAYILHIAAGGKQWRRKIIKQ